MNALIPFDEVRSIAQAMSTSGYFQDAADVSKAIVKILAGNELGLGPFAAMTGIHVIKGKPVMSSNLIATLIKNDPRYDYKIGKLDDDGCTIVFFENGERVGESSFTAADAKAAGLGGDNWRKFPRNMYFARAISNGAKWYTPGIFGGTPVYTADELGAEVDGETGEIITIDVTPRKPEPNGQTIEHEPEQADEWLQPVTVSTKSPLFKKFQALGSELYGPGWNDKRHQLSESVSHGRTTSSSELTVEEVQKLIDGMEKKRTAIAPDELRPQDEAYQDNVWKA